MLIPCSLALSAYVQYHQIANPMLTLCCQKVRTSGDDCPPIHKIVREGTMATGAATENNTAWFARGYYHRRLSTKIKFGSRNKRHAIHQILSPL